MLRKLMRIDETLPDESRGTYYFLSLTTRDTTSCNLLSDDSRFAMWDLLQIDHVTRVQATWTFFTGVNLLLFS